MKNSGPWEICVQLNNLLRSSTVCCLATHTDKYKMILRERIEDAIARKSHMILRNTLVQWLGRFGRVRIEI